MADTTPDQLVHRYVDEVINGGDMSVVSEIFSTDFEGHANDEVLGLETAPGPQGIIEAVGQMRAIIPDVRYVVEDLTWDGDTAHLTYIVEGTHDREFMGYPATNKVVRVSGRGWVKVANNKIVAGGSEWNPEDLFAQLKG